MSDTHPNAFRNEAADKRAQANVLLSEADTFDAQADALEGVEPQAEADTVVEAPDAVQAPDEVLPKDAVVPKKVEVKEG